MCPECGSGGCDRFKSQRLLNKIGLWDDAIATGGQLRAEVGRKEIVEIFAFVVYVKEANQEIADAMVVIVVLVQCLCGMRILVVVRYE